MRIDEITQPEVLEEFNLRKGLAAIAIAGSLAAGVATRTVSAHRDTPKADQQLTQIGRETIKSLPAQIQKRLGDPNTIIFVRGVPDGGEQNAVCQVGEGERIIYVNPKYIQQFVSGAADQLSAHELTHIAQDGMKRKFVDTNPNNKYGDMASPDAWQKLKALRAKGDNMWKHSREEQAMIVQQRQAQVDLIRNLQKSDTADKEQLIRDAKQKIQVFDQYINDFD